MIPDITKNGILDINDFKSCLTKLDEIFSKGDGLPPYNKTKTNESF